MGKDMGEFKEAGNNLESLPLRDPLFHSRLRPSAAPFVQGVPWCSTCVSGSALRISTTDDQTAAGIAMFDGQSPEATSLVDLPFDVRQTRFKSKLGHAPLVY